MTNENFRPTGYRLLPEVVKNLLIINVIMFVATLALQKQGIDLTDILGLHYFEGSKFRIFQVVTYLFMHGSWGHLFFNMFALWMFGSALENVWGPKKLLTYYILTGLGAALAHYILVYFELQPAIAYVNDYISNPGLAKLESLINSDAFKNFQSQELINHYNNFSADFNKINITNPARALDMSVEYMKIFKVDVFNAPVAIGASGAVFGLLLGFGMLFPNSIIYVYFALPIKTKYFVIIYGAIELFSGIAQVQGDNVAHFAHIGGLVTGIIIILYWRHKDRRGRDDYFNK